MFIMRSGPHLGSKRLDAGYYAPAHLADVDALRVWDQVPLEELRDRKAPIAYGALKPDGCGEKCRVAKFENFNGMFVRAEDCDPISEHMFIEFQRSQALVGDILIAIGGYVGRPAIVQTIEEGLRLNINRHLARFRPDPMKIDPYFALAYMSSRIGGRQLTREVTGSVQAGINLEDLRLVSIPTPSHEAQKYIGEKLRQAERLRGESTRLSDYAIRVIDTFMASRERASELELAVSESSEWQQLAASFLAKEPVRVQQTQPQRSWRVSIADLTSRLDCNFYSPEAIELDRRLASGYSTAALYEIIDPSRQITNGVRGPDLQSSPFKLVRLQDREGWSINFDRCLSISEVQFRENHRCELRERDVVAIGGYIGHAAIVRREQPAVIGQHSAVLPMGENSQVDEGFLVAYLSSRDGTVHLQRYVSGTVQAGINLEDLREVRVPVPAREFQRHVGDAVRRADDLAFWSERLCTAASRLIEEMIDGEIAEAELIAAQEALLSGDTTLDREILARVSADGIDGTGKGPLLPDIDAIYSAIENSQRSVPMNGDGA
jgi:type I restriction enzyme, S subunit